MHIIDSHFHWWPRSISERLCRRKTYPRAAVNGSLWSVPAGFLYHGALSTYEKLGFAPDRKIVAVATDTRAVGAAAAIAGKFVDVREWK